MTPTTTLLVATHNQGKVGEYADLLSDLDLRWLSLNDLGITLEVDETGSSFMENARLKAATYAQAAGLLTLADDSGLEVAALGGAPGVHTARFGGEGLTSQERYRLLLEKLRGVPLEERSARFVCAIALAAADGRILATASGSVAGHIAGEPAGDGGFGYDPVFYLPHLGQTMAQLPVHTKHAISHRGQALRNIEPQLRALLAGGY